MIRFVKLKMQHMVTIDSPFVALFPLSNAIYYKYQDHNEKVVRNMNAVSIGKRIRACREQKGWNQEEFAEKVGLSIPYIGMIERGEKVPKLETFVRIANTLEVTSDLLLADVLQVQPYADTSAISARINSLDRDGRDRIYDVVNTLLRHEKKR